MRGYIKYFDDGGKNMSFVTDDKEVYKKYNEIWEVVRKLVKLNITTFINNVIPEENTHYTCISAIDIDSVLKIDKKAFPQVYLEQGKYKLKKRKRPRYIEHLEVIDYNSENDSDRDNYVEIKNDNEIENIELFR